MKNLFIGEPDDTITLRYQPRSTHLITFMLFSFRMVTTIHFDNQLFVTTQEIHDVIANNMLPKELMTQIPIADGFPQHTLGKSHILSIFTSKRPKQLVPVRTRSLISHTLFNVIIPSLTGRVRVGLWLWVFYSSSSGLSSSITKLSIIKFWRSMVFLPM